jgi:hypothetical protein
LTTADWGALAAAAVTGKRPDIVAFIDGVTAAIGAIAGAVIVIGQPSIIDR